jgi:hypothetical protein
LDKEEEMKKAKYKYDTWLDSEIKRWYEKIEENDPLKGEKEEAITLAIELMYPTEIMEKILEAKTEIQIDNALKTGRCVGNELKFSKVIKNGASIVAYC